jgi:hypothetical protein
MTQTASMTHTLTGFVHEAQPGSYTILTSHDLSPFLTTITDTRPLTHRMNQTHKTDCDGVTHRITTPTDSFSNSPSKACLISFLAIDPTGGGEGGREGVQDSLNSHHSVLRIKGCVITLERPYNGPSIVNGVPRVVLRTNLIPSSACLPTGRGGGRRAETESIASISLASPATVIRAHPLLPYLFVGHLDDSLSLITPEAQKEEKVIDKSRLAAHLFGQRS